MKTGSIYIIFYKVRILKIYMKFKNVYLFSKENRGIIVLKTCNLIRVIAPPSISALHLGDSMILAKEKLESLGFYVDYGGTYF